MKIAVTADLHYGVENNQDICEKLVQDMVEKDPDVIILAGDLFHFESTLLHECLSLFKEFKGEKLFVAGNHDIWTHKENSLERYEKVLPEIVKGEGFHVLDEKPFIKDSVGFVGNIGWYDYTFKDVTIPISQEYYDKKSWPGSVMHNDGQYVHLGISDIEFANRLNKKLMQDLEAVNANPSISTIVCAFHHVPFKELQHSHHTQIDKFLTAFSGSEKTGNICLSFPKVKYVFCGHTHERKQAVIQGVHAINIGSDYIEKRFDILEV